MAAAICLTAVGTPFTSSAMENSTKGFEISAYKSGSSNFQKAWKATKTHSASGGKLTYGFNTFAINEDISWSYNDTFGHTAILNRGGTVTSKSGSKYNWAKLENQHKSNTVTYKSVF